MDQPTSTIISPSVSPVNTTQSPELTKKPNLHLIYGILFVFCIVILITIEIYLYPRLQAINSEINSLPVSMDNQYIDRLELSYVFTGRLINIISGAKGQQLITNITGKGIPDFIVDKNTKILVKNSEGKVATGDIKELNKGDQIEITAFYNIKNKAWSMSFVKAAEDRAKNSLKTSPSSSSSTKLR